MHRQGPGCTNRSAIHDVFCTLIELKTQLRCQTLGGAVTSYLAEWKGKWEGQGRQPQLACKPCGGDRLAADSQLTANLQIKNWSSIPLRRGVRTSAEVALSAHTLIHFGSKEPCRTLAWDLNISPLGTPLNLLSCLKLVCQSAGNCQPTGIKAMPW